MRLWRAPSFDDERCELVRTSRDLDVDLSALEKAMHCGRPMLLDEDRWREVENADSADEKLTFDHALQLAEEYGRDLKGIIAAFEQQAAMPMPVLLDRGCALYCVGGNTRLMACRLLGIRPEVWVLRLEET